MRRMSALIIVCLLSVCAFADEAGNDCSSEIAKTLARDSQIKTLESQLEKEKASSKKIEQGRQKADADLQDLKSSSKKNRK